MTHKWKQTKSTQTIPGELEIDFLRGVIYFHDTLGKTRLRISNAKLKEQVVESIDINIIGMSVEYK